jgi:hypothetical protein
MRALSHSLLILPLVVALPVVATAQTLPEGIDIRGEAELEALSSGSADQTVAYADLDVSFGFGAGSMGLGLDLGILAFDADTDSDSVLFAALTYGTEFGKISVGASYHNFNDQDADVIDIALGYQTGMFFVAGGVELVDAAGGGDSDIYHIEAGAETDYYSAGIGFTSTDDFGGDATMAWASYSALPNTDLTVTVFDLEGTTLYGLSGEWRFLSHSFVQLGVADTSDSDAIWDASIGLRF